MTPRPATAQPAQYPRLMTAAHRCLVDLMTSVPALDPHVWFEQRQGAFGMVTHVPFPTLNGVWLHDSSATTSDVTELLDALPAEGMMHCLQAAPGVRESATAIAEARGMTPGPDVPLMVLDRVPAEVKTSGLRIRELGLPNSTSAPRWLLPPSRPTRPTCVRQPPCSAGCLATACTSGMWTANR